ncbi:MAG: T9SS type A sorting domain-containing protein [Bacteroidota bacterium]
MASPTFVLYPNPSSGQVLIQAEYSDESSLRIFGTNGSLIRSQPWSGGPIELSGLPNGIYWIELMKGAASLGVEKLVLIR